MVIEMRIIQQFRIFFLTGLLCLFFAGCGGGRSSGDETVIRIGNGGEPRDLDPHTVTGVPEVSIILTLLEGLVAYHPTNDEIPYPGIAERWEVSEDGRTWRFFLREANWSNGDPLTAHDFVYGWRRVLEPALGNEYTDWMYMIEGAEAFHKGEIDDITKVGIRAESDHIFTVVLREPTADFLKMLLNHTFLPVHKPTIEAHGGPGVRQSGWTQPGSFVGNGPYNLVEWKPNSVIRVERNPYYWDAESVRTDVFEFYPIDDVNTEMRAFESGQLHVTGSLPANMRTYYKENFPEKIRFDPFAGVYFYRINTTRPPVDDVRVRKALSLTIDRELIISQLLKGNERVATSYIPRGTGGYEFPGRETYNPDKARTLLAEAGYPGGEGFPEIELLFNTSDNHRKIAEAIQNMWRNDLGIDITLTNMEWKVYLDTTKDMQYDIARAGWIANLYPYSFLRIFLSYSPNNDTGFANPEYDRLLEESTHTLDQEKRYELVRRAEEIFMEVEPVIPIYWYTNVFLIDPRVREWTSKLVNQRPMKFIYLEE
jgi:oligopeptide transport system substrate-binding protein